MDRSKKKTRISKQPDSGPSHYFCEDTENRATHKPDIFKKILDQIAYISVMLLSVVGNEMDSRIAVTVVDDDDDENIV